MELQEVRRYAAGMPLSKQTLNNLALYVASHRSLKRILNRFLPAFALLPIEGGWKLALDPRDLRGPSFHMARGRKNPSLALGGYEPLQRKLVEESLIRGGAGAVFLDVGSNIGLFTFPMALKSPSAKIYGFEPHMRNAVCFAETIRENSLRNVTLVPAALGDADGECRLFFDESDSGGHSTLPENLWNNRGRTESQKVPAMKLDTFMQQRSLARIDVVKIDVQGAEDGVLRGGADALRKYLPDLLIEAQHEKVVDEDAILKEVGAISGSYRFRTMESADWRPLSELKAVASGRFDEDILFADYFFSARE